MHSEKRMINRHETFFRSFGPVFERYHGNILCFYDPQKSDGSDFEESGCFVHLCVQRLFLSFVRSSFKYMLLNLSPALECNM
jgi:hypothetical protein